VAENIVTEKRNNREQASVILQKVDSKLEIIIEAMRSGELTENAQFGLRAILSEIKADLEQLHAESA